ncbi:hypothetical protein K469DRAFT_545477 [Zopfia rhizophila CBS 207.26]|uniref:Transcription factor IIIC putative zinc-finger domain-containing protein n=1 Tax=Zopfia rhizophila CBS 207.26 TaxID=1314779 RepID=A0A6A6EUW0_9PEZI|nr:hypothetical protein K469DRAFT_545477 [Zopfia rhizophila CBS 207.26]
MSDVTTLNCWPSAIDAIDWSQDGIIALATEESVELLFPNLNPSRDSDQDDAQWRHFPILVSWFTNEELPIKDPAPFKTFSIGEEISSSAVTGISWSAPGIAKHRRCALAVLTSNLVLAIWASESKPQERSSWGRVLIINDSLDDYFQRNGQDEDSHLVSQPEEKTRLRKRVRAFSWAPSMNNTEPFGTIGSQTSWGPHILVISNDDNQVVFLAIKSPTSTLSPEGNWRAEVLGHFGASANMNAVIPTPGIFDEWILQQRYISHLAWSPWTNRGDKTFCSVLAYATNTDLRARMIAYSHEKFSIGEEIVYQSVDLRYSGPIKWSPKVGNDETMYLVLFCQTDVTCLIVSAKDASVLGCTTRHLDGWWDTVSGIVFDSRSPSEPRLHFSSLLSTTRYPTTSLRVSREGFTALPPPYWRSQIQEIQVYFSARHELHGNANAKTWGLASSPLGDFIATCSSPHPTDMVEYLTPSEQRTMIAISNMGEGGGELYFPAQGTCAESILFVVKKWFEYNSETEEKAAVAKAEVLKKLMESFGPPREVERNHSNGAMGFGTYETIDPSNLLTAFKQSAYFDGNSLKDRYNILVSTVCSPEKPNSLERIMIPFRLTKEVQKLPQALCQSEFSQKIMGNMQVVSQMLFKKGGYELALSNNRGYPVDTCDFCNSEIKMESLDWARCVNGHQFKRCSLSFLAIQAPGILKYCDICKKPYFNDDFVFSQEDEIGIHSSDQDTEMQDEQANSDATAYLLTEAAERLFPGPAATLRETPQEDLQERGLQEEQKSGNSNGEINRYRPEITLAKLLFAACDACIYCGGKFIG